MRGEVKRFTKRYRSLKRSIEATVLQKLAPPLPFFLSVGFIRGKKRNEKKKNKKIRKKKGRKGRKKKERGGEGKGKKKRKHAGMKRETIQLRGRTSKAATRNEFFSRCRGEHGPVPSYQDIVSCVTRLPRLKVI